MGTLISIVLDTLEEMFNDVFIALIHFLIASFWGMISIPCELIVVFAYLMVLPVFWARKRVKEWGRRLDKHWEHNAFIIPPESWAEWFGLGFAAILWGNIIVQLIMSA